MISIDIYQSPIGKMTMAGDENALCGLWFEGQKYFGSCLPERCERREIPVFTETKRWLAVYFAGEIPDFVPPLSLRATSFRRAVWEILLTVSYGKTVTYGEIAAEIARRWDVPRMSAQAVGNAVGHNPVSLIVPCHRVVGSNGSLTGYAGGIEKKGGCLRWRKASANRSRICSTNRRVKFKDSVIDFR